MNYYTPQGISLKRYKGEEFSKCHICGYYMPDSLINKDGICINCENNNENFNKK